MDDLNHKIEFNGKSGTVYSFVLCYDLTQNEQPRNAGLFVFTKKTNAVSHSVLDVQLLLNEDEIAATVQRMKADGAMYAFWKDCTDETGCDAQIDDIKRGEDYRSLIE